MNWLLEPFQFEFMQRALLGCMLMGFTNGFLSAFIVLRRMALLADALSHSLLPGLAIGAIFFGLAPLGLFSGALVAALLVVLGGLFLAQNSRLKEDTAVGALYIMAFALGIVLLKYSSVRVDLGHFLFGNILGLADADLWMMYGVSFFTIALLVAWQRPLLLVLFDATVAAAQGLPVRRLSYLLIGLTVLSMIASLQAVGVVLSLGLLILPAAAIYLWSDSFTWLAWGGGLLGLLGSVAGLFLSYWFNLPSGPAIVLVLGVVFLGSYLFSPRYGLFRRWHAPRHLHHESLARWPQPPPA
jgi:ABC-type Mn2+/Zn2+ transport system permease subunit